MELKDRLKIFINSSNKNFKQFSEYCYIENTTLCKYVNGKFVPTEAALLKLYQAGINICWLLSGEGSMFASNKTGQELRNKHEKIHPEFGVEMMKVRIKKWIKDHYKTNENFSKEMKINVDDFEKELKDYNYASPMFLTLIVDAGCNLDWAISGKGSVYSISGRGLMFQFKKDGRKIMSDNITEEEFAPELKVIYNVMRKAVRDEMNKIGKEK